ncbi:MAG: hypothetical protein HYY84_00905 [Deltaproteobacteria bacterium]|nr:hypothetical protein [Deltaproteobacteria bacterium]
MPDPSRPIIALILTLDRATLLYTLPIAVGIALLVTVILFRERRAFELVSIFFLVVTAILGVTFLGSYFLFSIDPPRLDVVAWQPMHSLLGND